ncbi:hypothetical protein ABLN64_20190 [Mycobacterium tuberculosis]
MKRFSRFSCAASLGASDGICGHGCRLCGVSAPQLGSSVRLRG